MKKLMTFIFLALGCFSQGWATIQEDDVKDAIERGSPELRVQRIEAAPQGNGTFLATTQNMTTGQRQLIIATLCGIPGAVLGYFVLDENFSSPEYGGFLVGLLSALASQAEISNFEFLYEETPRWAKAAAGVCVGVVLVPLAACFASDSPLNGSTICTEYLPFYDAYERLGQWLDVLLGY